MDPFLKSSSGHNSHLFPLRFAPIVGHRVPPPGPKMVARPQLPPSQSGIPRFLEYMRLGSGLAPAIQIYARGRRFGYLLGKYALEVCVELPFVRAQLHVKARTGHSPLCLTCWGARYVVLVRKYSHQVYWEAILPGQ